MDNANNSVHAFEARGLGKAPFRFVGIEQQDLCYGRAILNRAEYQRTGISVTTAPGGTCAFCGQYIVNMFNIVSADGKRFHVGSDCVEKTGDAGLRKLVNKAVTKIRREQRQARERAIASQNAASLADDLVRAALATQPSPNKYRADKGETLLDWAEWMHKNGGARADREVRKVIAAVVERAA